MAISKLRIGKTQAYGYAILFDVTEPNKRGWYEKTYLVRYSFIDLWDQTKKMLLYASSLVFCSLPAYKFICTVCGLYVHKYMFETACQKLFFYNLRENILITL